MCGAHYQTPTTLVVRAANTPYTDSKSTETNSGSASEWFSTKKKISVAIDIDEKQQNPKNEKLIPENEVQFCRHDWWKLEGGNYGWIDMRCPICLDTFSEPHFMRWSYPFV